MEETREKIELFRNYYFVCFRSFDQDPYSPTHLEPLNMYIIVFREGILSVSLRSQSLRAIVLGLLPSPLTFHLYLSVPFHAHATSTKCPSTYQTAQRLH